MASYTFKYDHPADEVYVTGTFDNWTKSQKLDKNGSLFSKTVDLPTADKIYYKFVADGDWQHDPTAKAETDHEGNINNVLDPSDLEAPTAGAHALNSAGPGASTAAMAGAQPLTSSSRERQEAPPGAFPETPANETPTGPGSEQVYGVNPIPASSGTGNPVQVAPGDKLPEQSTFNDTTVTSHAKDDEALKDSAQDSEQAFGVAPLPATGGTANPVKLQPGEQVPDASTMTGHTTTSNVKLDQDSYEKSDAGAPVLPPALSPTSEKEAAGATAIFAGLGPQTSNMIPESSMGMGPDAPAPIDAQDSGPVRSGVAPTSTTNALAGQQPIRSAEERGAPAVVAESQKEAHVDPEASASPRALQEKDEMESELHSKVPEQPAIHDRNPEQESSGTSTGGVAATAAAAAAGAGAAAAGTAYAMRYKAEETTGKDPVSMLPEGVQQSLNGLQEKVANNEPVMIAGQEARPSHPLQTSPAGGGGGGGGVGEAPPSAPAPVQSTPSDAALPQQVRAGEPVQVPGATADADADAAVPAPVLTSQKEAHADPEASADRHAVQEKTEFERELVAKVSGTEAAGEPAPTTTAAASSGAALASSTAPLASADQAPPPTAKQPDHPTPPPAPSSSSPPSGAPQLADPTSGVAPLSLEDQAGSKELNAPAGAPAQTPGEKVNQLVGLAREEDDAGREPSRDVSPMTKAPSATKTGGGGGQAPEQPQPTVTTGLEAAKAAPVVNADASGGPGSGGAGGGGEGGAGAGAGAPVGTPRNPSAAAAAAASTPQKRGSFIDRMRNSPADSQKSGKSAGGGAGSTEGGKKRGFFGRLKEKLK